MEDANLVVKHLDLASLESIRACAKDINETESRLDVLINNAGTICFVAFSFGTAVKIAHFVNVSFLQTTYLESNLVIV